MWVPYLGVPGGTRTIVREMISFLNENQQLAVVTFVRDPRVSCVQLRLFSGPFRKICSPWHILTLPLYVLLSVLWGIVLAFSGYKKFIVCDGAFTGFSMSVVRSISNVHLFVFDFGFVVNLIHANDPLYPALRYMPSKLNKMYRFFLLRMAGRTMASADRLFVYSDEMELAYRRLGANESAVTRYSFPVPNESIPETRSADGKSGTLVKNANDVFLVYIGRFSLDKDLSTLLKAFKRAAFNFPNLRLILAGDGPLKEELLGQNVASYGNVTYVGRLDEPQEVASLLKLCDIFVYPMRVSGGYSMSVLEAMAAGKPVIITDVGPTADLIDQGVNGIKVPLGDDREMEKAIYRMTSDEDLRKLMGARAKALIPVQFSQEYFHRTLMNWVLADNPT